MFEYDFVSNSAYFNYNFLFRRLKQLFVISVFSETLIGIAGWLLSRRTSIETAMLSLLETSRDFRFITSFLVLLLATRSNFCLRLPSYSGVCTQTICSGYVVCFPIVWVLSNTKCIRGLWRPIGRLLTFLVWLTTYRLIRSCTKCLFRRLYAPSLPIIRRSLSTQVTSLLTRRHSRSFPAGVHCLKITRAMLWTLMILIYSIKVWRKLVRPWQLLLMWTLLHLLEKSCMDP